MRSLVLLLVAACGARSAAPAEPITNTTPAASSRGCIPAADPTMHFAGDTPNIVVREVPCLPDVAMVDLGGRKYDRSTLAGGVVVINFFATWDSSSRYALPHIAAAARRYREVTFLGVLTSDEVDDKTLVKYLVDHEVRFPVVRATPAMMDAFERPANLPLTFIFGPRGALESTIIGFVDEDMLREILDTLVTK